MPPTTIISPGVSVTVNNQSQTTQLPIQAGAAIIGPTVKGKVGIPTIVTTYSEYENMYGTTFKSGSQMYSYLTSVSAYNYFNRGGTSLLVTRVVSGSFSSATASIQSSIAATSASANISMVQISASVASNATDGSNSFTVNGITFYFTGSNVANTNTIIYVNTSSFAASTPANYAATSSAIFAYSSSLSPYNATLNTISSSYASTNIKLTYTGSNGLVGNANTYITGSTLYPFSNLQNFTGGTNTTSFTLATLSEGLIMNSDGTEFRNGSLANGTVDNLRYQISQYNPINGTFTLLIRQGNDITNSPSVLETWTNLSLDPISPNYIEKIIGNQQEIVQSDSGEYYVNLTGTYQNKSKYIRINSVNLPTPEYLDNSSVAKPQYTGSIPYLNRGNFGGAIGSNISATAGNYYENISDLNTQGLPASAYTESISLLANKDAFKYNFITTPGLVADGANFPSHYSVITSLISMVQTRGDSMTVVDVVGKGANISTVTSNATAIDNSYVATYWPWLQTVDPTSGQQIWTPPSTLIPGVYAFTDTTTAPWFAPAGTNRGVLSNVISAERILTQGNRDSLYSTNVNPIATYTVSGIVVFGQKTLQKKADALDRVNVRRLLIDLTSYISQVANNLVFEQNTTATRNEFLSQVNPYLQSVQIREGLDEFNVVMDETNNTPTTIDNNQLIGQIYLKPTKSIEFILLEFNISPSGAIIG
jgi:hypothetical protein